MTFTLDRWLALAVTLINGVLGGVLGHFSESRWREAGLAVLLSLPGLAVIWFRDSLQDSELAFPRGVRNASPPGLLAFLGWLWLLAIPILYVYKLSEHL